jgi:solute carrier family 35 (GDP-fucose transporter), member C1
MMDSTSKHAPALRVAAVVSFYMGAALVMVFVNKTVLNSTPDAPLLFLFLQLIIAVLLLHVSALFSSRIEIPQWDRHTVRKLVPVVTINIVGLVFNTLCLREVEATFFQIARGLVLPLTIAVTSATTHSHPSSRVIIAAGAVTVGFFVGVAPEGGLPAASIPSPISLFYGVFSSLSIAVHSVLVKSSLPYCNNSTIQLAYWTNAGSAILLAPFVLLHGEPAKLLELSASAEWDMKVFVWGSLVTGCFGFLLCVAGLLSIKVTSPVTHMFSSAARSVIQTLLGVWIFSDILTVNRVISLSTILGGTMFYTWIKATEHASPQPPAKPVDLEALNHVKDVKNESNDGQTQEKPSASD